MDALDKLHWNAICALLEPIFVIALGLFILGYICRRLLDSRRDDPGLYFPLFFFGAYSCITYGTILLFKCIFDHY